MGWGTRHRVKWFFAVANRGSSLPPCHIRSNGHWHGLLEMIVQTSSSPAPASQSIWSVKDRRQWNHPTCYPCMCVYVRGLSRQCREQQNTYASFRMFIIRQKKTKQKDIYHCRFAMHTYFIGWYILCACIVGCTRWG